MPEFPKVGGATAAEVWAAATRKLTGLDGQPRTDLMGEDLDFEAGAGARKSRIDAAISAVKAKTDIIGASVALESAGNLAAVKTKTDALPADPASNTQVNTRASAIDYTAGRAAKIDKIQDFLEEGTGTLTADGTEQIVRAYTGTGKLHVYIDLFNMAAPDTTTIRQFMMIKTAGTYRKFAEEIYSGVQALPLLHILMRPGKFGVKITLQQTAPTYKTYDWESLVEQAAA